MDADARVELLLGNPRKAIIAMAIPIILSMIVAEINTLADRAWCSGMGVEAMASVALIRPIYCVYVGLGSGLGVGAAAVISRYLGAEKPKDASAAAIQALIIGIVFALVLTPILFFTQNGLLEIIGSEDINGAAADYMTLYTLSLAIIVTNGVIGGILNGQGATGLSTVMMMVLAVSNMILDPILIYGAGMGLTGASLATVIATAISMLVGIWYMIGRRTYLRFSRASIAFDRTQMKAIGKAGIPQMLEYVVIYAMDIILNMIIIGCAGSEGFTIFSTPDAVVFIMIVPSMAVGSALVTVASSAYGQGNIERMREAFRFAVMFGLGMTLTLVLIAELIPSIVMTPFTYSDEMRALRPQIADTLRILALYAPLFSMTPLCSGFLQAMKYPTYSVIIAIIRNLILIGLYLIAATISLTAICWFLDLGHVIGAVMISVVTFIVFRRVCARMKENPSQML